MSDSVRTKFGEVHFHLERLAKSKAMKEFYPSVNAFLAAARSVLYVACHELGWKERRPAQRVGFNSAQISVRQRFDQWFDSSATVKAVLVHPLTDERHVVVHRGGQAGFFHVPKPHFGLAISEGNAHGPGLVVRKGRMSLPLEDVNTFWYRDRSGSKHEAIAYCRAYLELIGRFFSEVERGAWR
jgi:hypothetical protein